MSELKAGRELDAAVARVLGVSPTICETCPDHYSTHPASSAVVKRWLLEKVENLEIRFNRADGGWFAYAWSGDGRPQDTAFGTTETEAIALLVLAVAQEKSR